MSIQEQDWISERNRLGEVRERVRQEIARLEEITEHRETEVLDIRRNFWDEITVNRSSYDEVAETAASITQQQALLTQQERSFRHARNTLKNLDKMEKSPYFARIDFLEEGTSQPDPEQVYIGIHSLFDEETNEIFVYDWRAPISGMFYDYTPGPAAYETPDGIVTGEMKLKRQYIIKNGSLENMFDTGVSIGDEMLQYILAKSAHEKMSSIVTTIQQEQNRIIRDDKNRILIVQGAAGSGKTSVALQRVAYLLYKYRNTLSADNMVLFSPNSIFNDYVSNVLPELGEANMQQTTFLEHLERGFSKGIQVQDAYDQLEFLLTANESEPEYEARVRGIEWKTSIQFLELLNRYIERLKNEGIMLKEFKFREKVLISQEQLQHLFYNEFGEISSISNRIEKIREWVLGDLEQWEKRLFKNIYRKMVNNPKYLGTEEEMKADSRKKAKKAMEPLRGVAKELAFVDVMGMYSRLFRDKELIRSLTETGEEIHQYELIGNQTIAKLTDDIILYEDATPILYLKAAFEGMNTYNQIRQVIIDEAQDYTPFQFQYIRRLFPRARFTLLGDLNQGIYHANVQSYQMIGQLFGGADVGIARMTKSYRSTNEIIEFTRGILRQAEPIEPIGRHGDEPELIHVSKEEQLAGQVANGIEAMMAEGAESIAVICKTERETKQAFEALKGVTSRELHLITKSSWSFVSGVVVVPAYLAKGLEFDGVIVYNASQDVYQRDTERKLLYTACTRALHYLKAYYTGELSPLVGQKQNA